MASNPNRKKTLPDGRIYEYKLSEAALEKERQAHIRWRAENYYRLYVYAPKELKDQLNDLAKKRGMSLSALVVSVLEKELRSEAAET